MKGRCMSNEIKEYKFFINISIDGKGMKFEKCDNDNFDEDDVVLLGKAENYKNKIIYKAEKSGMGYRPSVFLEEMTVLWADNNDMHPDANKLMSKFDAECEITMKKVCEKNNGVYFEFTIPAWNPDDFNLTVCELLNKKD